MSEAHSRRGAWRASFCGLLVMGGYENSWGPHMRLEPDAPGAAQMAHLRRFFTETVDFETLRPRDGLVSGGREEAGGAPLCLADKDGVTIAVYLPLGGAARVPSVAAREAAWFDPRTGATRPATLAGGSYVSPAAPESRDDMVLLLRR